jgi:hypothetical protein
MGLRLDSSTASTTSFAGPGPKRLASQHLDGFIGDGPGAYNASLLLAAAKPEPIIVNVNIAKRS